MCYFFFFSSRRRHTRCSRDWSSDVCSSDLITTIQGATTIIHAATTTEILAVTTTVRELTMITDIVMEAFGTVTAIRSEEHTSELQSRLHLVCRLLLEKKKKTILTI